MDWLSADRAQAILAEFIAAAICHSTNWDRLREALAELAEQDEFTAERLGQLTFLEFVDQLGSAFADGDDLRVRHRLLVETANAVEKTGIAGQIESTDSPTLLAGRNGLYGRIRQIEAFNGDPEGKKLRILVQQLTRTRLIRPWDPEAMRPAIEYHLIRLYLRTGRVQPVREVDAARLTQTTTFRAHLVMRVRQAVEEAMFYTASAAETTIPNLNHIEWQIARSYCARDRARCDGPAVPGKPLDAELQGAHGGCPLKTVCVGANSQELADLVEPQLSPRYDFY